MYRYESVADSKLQRMYNFSLVEYYQGDMFQVLTSGLDSLIGAQRIKGTLGTSVSTPGIYFTGSQN